ncbi:MAG: hypothetical protein JKY31_06760 [Rhodobacteraceae bacterium]|nr:hypothetical protein [Paracoccaceae bacterium]
MQKAEMTILVSAEFLNNPVPDVLRLENITPWLSVENPIWEGAPPLGVFLSGSDAAVFKKSDFKRVMALMSVPLGSRNLLDFAIDSLSQQVASVTFDATQERSAAAALRRDYMRLQSSFLAVEGFLNGTMAPKFTLAREWGFAEKSLALMAGDIVHQALPVSSAALLAVDLWSASGGAVKISVKRPDGANYLDPIDLSFTESGWQRAQFPMPISGNANDVSLEVEALSGVRLGLSYPSALQEFNVKNHASPLALRLWKGLAGVKAPAVHVRPSDTVSRAFILPADIPKAEFLGNGSAKYLETQNIIAIHTDYYGVANLVFRGMDVSAVKNLTAYVQNAGPETLEITLVLVATGAAESAKMPTSIYLAPETYAQCEIQVDSDQATDLIVKIKGKTSLDMLTLRGIGFEPTTR